MNTDTNFKLILTNGIITSSCLSNPDLIQEVYYVVNNPAKIEKLEVIKAGGIISKVKAYEEFKLNSHRIIVKQNERSNIVISDEMQSKSIVSNTNISQKISENIDSCFIKVLKSDPQSSEEVKLKRNFLDIFRNITKEDLINKFEKFNWIITTEEVANSLKEIGKFSKIEDDGTINHFGKIENLSIFTHPEIEPRTIYAGKLDSVMSIINKDIKIEEFDSGNFYKRGFKIEVEYLIKAKGVIKYTLK